MRILEPIKNRSIAFLWGGQVFSAIGDELHEVAMVWLAAGMIGHNTGYLMAVQAISILASSLLGGIWADHWDHRKTMIYVDLLRGLAVLSIPIAGYFGSVSLWILILVTIIVSSLRAFFDPALRAVLPRLARDAQLLHSTNALMETTSRFAKIIGPGLVGLLGKLIPTLQYFTVDAISYFLSAFSIARLKNSLPPEGRAKASEHSKSIRTALLGGFRLAKSKPLVHFIIYTDSLVVSAWYFVFPLAVGLLLHEKMPENISALSLLVGAYGIGNLSANILLGNIEIRRFDRCLFFGRIVVGSGFLLLALAPNFSWMLVAAAISATAGPMTDLSKLTLIQRAFTSREIAKVYRFNMSAIHSVLLCTMLASPQLLSIFSITTLIAAAGILMAGFGVLGLLRFSNFSEAAP